MPSSRSYPSASRRGPSARFWVPVGQESPRWPTCWCASTTPIRFDGRDLRDLTLASLRRAVVLLDQTPYLYQASVRENIAYGRPDATIDEIREAACAAAIHERILAMPEGYETIVAERGQT